MKGIPQVGILPILILAKAAYAQNTLEYGEAVRHVNWEDYLCGIYTEADALRLVRYTNNQMKRTLSDHADSRIDALLVETLENINRRIPIERRSVYDSLRIGTKENAWLYGNPDGPNCKSEPELCEHLQSIQKNLSLRQVDEAYKLAQQLPTLHERALRHPLVRQLMLAATLVMYDKSTPDACLPIWQPGANLTPDAKLTLVQGVMKIITKEANPITTTEACFQLGRNSDDRHCWNALAAIGFAPLLDTLHRAIQLPDEERLAMEVCIRGQLDPCLPLTMKDAQTSLEGRTRRMLNNFTEQCQWKEALGKLTDACPNPHATLPLHRSLNRDSTLDEQKKEDVARDERWFWIHVYTGQCEKARLIFEHLSSTYGRAEAGSATAFALRRMQGSLEQCQSYKVGGLAESEKSLNLISLMMEGNLQGAKEALIKATEAGKLKPKQLKYYDALWLMNSYPRILDVSGLISAPLLVPNQFDENLRILRSLDLVFNGQKLPEELGKIQAVQKATLLLLAGKWQELLEDYEKKALQQPDPVMSDLLGTARICMGTRKAFCSSEMDQHVKVALQLPHIRPKTRLYENVRELVCEKTAETIKATMDDTTLFKMNATWAELFGHVGRYFKFPNDPKEGILAIVHQFDGADSKVEDEATTSEVSNEDSTEETGQVLQDDGGKAESSENGTEEGNNNIKDLEEEEEESAQNEEKAVESTQSQDDSKSNEEESTEQTTEQPQEEEFVEEASQEENNTSAETKKAKDSKPTPQSVAKKIGRVAKISKKISVDKKTPHNAVQKMKKPIKKRDFKPVSVQKNMPKKARGQSTPQGGPKPEVKAETNTGQPGRKATQDEPNLKSALRKPVRGKENNKSSEPRPPIQEKVQKQPEQPPNPTDEPNKATVKEPEQKQISNSDIIFAIDDKSKPSSSEDNQSTSIETEEESNNHEEESNNHGEESNNHEEESNNHEEERNDHDLKFIGYFPPTDKFTGLFWRNDDGDDY